MSPRLLRLPERTRLRRNRPKSDALAASLFKTKWYW